MDAALFSFSFISNLSVYQLIIVLFDLPAITLNIFMSLDFIRSLVSLLIMLFAELGIAKKPTKSAPLEKQLLILISEKYKSSVKTIGIRKATRKRAVTKVPETVEIVACDSTRIPI